MNLRQAIAEIYGDDYFFADKTLETLSVCDDKDKMVILESVKKYAVEKQYYYAAAIIRDEMKVIYKRLRNETP